VRKAGGQGGAKWAGLTGVFWKVLQEGKLGRLGGCWAGDGENTQAGRWVCWRAGGLVGR